MRFAWKGGRYGEPLSERRWVGTGRVKNAVCTVVAWEMGRVAPDTQFVWAGEGGGVPGRERKQYSNQFNHD